MANNRNDQIEADYFAFLNRVLVNPSLLKGNSAEFQLVINKLMLLNDTDQLKEIRNKTYSMAKLSPPPFSNSFTAVQEIRQIILNISQSSQTSRINAVREISNETNVSRVKTADKQTKAMTDFIKG